MKPTEKEKMLELASQRMSALLIELQLEADDLGQSIGRKKGDVIRNVINKRNGITRNLAYPICQKFPQISYEWLITGKEPMKSSGNEIRPIPEIQTSECKLCIANERIIKLLEEKIEDQKKTIERLRRLGGSGVIPETTPETIPAKKNG